MAKWQNHSAIVTLKAQIGIFIIFAQKFA